MSTDFPAYPTLPAPTPEKPPQPAAPPRRAGWKWAVAAVGVVLVALAGGLWWWLRDIPPEPPFPPEILDAEVKESLEQARGRLVDDPYSGAAWGEYGTVLLANLFDREAVQCFAEATKRDLKDPRWPYARGIVALKREPGKAIELLTTAAEVAPARSEHRQPIRLTLAEAYLERGEFERAEAIFEQEDRPPHAERARFGLGLVALARNDNAAATRHFEAVQNHPACRKQARAQLALLARAAGNDTTAKQYEAEAASLDPDPPWPDPYLDRVVTLQVGYRGLDRRVGTLERDGHFAEAARLCLAYANQKPSSKLLTTAGVNIARLGAYDDALEHLREAVRLEPDDSKARYTLALVLFTKWEKVAVHNPGSAEAAAGFREVVEQARKATELKADFARAYLFWGLALKFLGEPKAAVEPLRTGLTIEPELFDLHLALGQVLAASGDRSGAEASLKTAQRLRPNDPRPPQELARLQGGS